MMNINRKNLVHIDKKNILIIYRKILINFEYEITMIYEITKMTLTI